MPRSLIASVGARTPGMTATWLLTAALCCAMLPSCAGLPPEEALTARAQAFWDAKVGEDWPRAYAFLEPAWREHTRFEEWIQGVVAWRSAEVLSVGIKGRSGCARVRYEYEVLTTEAAGEKGVMQVEEPWLLVKGVWYRKEVPRTMKKPMEALGWEFECGTPAGE